MSELNDSFAKLYGRQLTDSEIQKLYRVRDALEIKNNDALWLVIMALQFYQTEYEKIPSLISKTTNETLSNIKSTADATMQASAAEVKRYLAVAVADSAKKIAYETATKQMWLWATGCIAISIISLSGISWYMNKKGQESGYNEGYKVGFQGAKDENLISYWASTPEGRYGFDLGVQGSLEKLVKCNQPGWEVKDGYCFVKPTKKVIIHGWAIPPDPKSNLSKK